MVIDTSIFIEFQRSKDKTKAHLYRLPESINLYVTSVTFYELLMGATDQTKRDDIFKLTSDLPVLPFDDSVALKSSEIYHLLRKQNKMIEFRDIFIAATCMVYELPLKTLNTKHFSRISGLTLA